MTQVCQLIWGKFMFKYRKWYLLNGKKQYVYIIGTNVNHPILIYLHGGPGDSALPLVEHFNADLSQKYTLVIWEQRGSGKSYYKFAENEKLTINDFVLDLKILVEKVLTDFGKKKICLFGHSWGSIIGMKFILSFPELVEYYIGVGQVINSFKMFEKSKEYAANHIYNTTERQKVINLDVTFKQKLWYSDLMFLMNHLVKQGVSLYGKKSYISLYKYFIFSKEYSLVDCINRLKGSKQSILKLWNEVATIDFSNHKEFDVPVVFIEGEHDYHVPSEIVLNFYDNLISPKMLYYMKDSAHFPQWTRNKTFNTIVNALDSTRFSPNNKIMEV